MYIFYICICLDQIMCLQEVQEDHYQKQIKPCLEHLGTQYLTFSYSSEQRLAINCSKDDFKSVKCKILFKRKRPQHAIKQL